MYWRIIILHIADVRNTCMLFSQTADTSVSLNIKFYSFIRRLVSLSFQRLPTSGLHDDVTRGGQTTVTSGCRDDVTVGVCDVRTSEQNDESESGSGEGTGRSG